MASEELEYALLLEESCGRKYLTDCMLSNPNAYNLTIVKEGTILKVAREECQALKKSDFIFNYKVMDDSNVKLLCNVAQIRQISYHQMLLLRAVENIQDRIAVLDRLPWAERLRNGVGIHVTIPNYPYPVKGVIQEIGEYPNKDGIHFHVRLIGSDGNRDFQKFKHKTVIVPVDKITESSSTDAAMGKESLVDHSGMSQKVGFKIGDRVMVRNKNDELIQGTIQFVDNQEKYFKSGPIVGIELDQKTHPTFILGNIKGPDNLFMTTSYEATKVFLPLSAVTKVEDIAPSAPSTHHYYTRQAAKKQQQQLVSHDQPLNRKDVQHYSNHNRPTVDRSQKPARVGKPLPGRVERVHEYEPPPGPPEESHITPDRENKPVKQPPSRNPDQSTIVDENPYNLEKESMIEFSNPPRYGVVKWIGYLEDTSKQYKIAGVEMEELFPGSHDGMWNGIQYFKSQKGRGLFLPLMRLKPDKRFGGVVKTGEQQIINQKVEVLAIDDRYVPAKLDTGTHIGKIKGIQGQHNSCYIDATLFGMFAFSDAFDDLFLDRCFASTEIEKKKEKVQDIIQQKIVYPLREKGFVVFNAIMELRVVLDSLKDMKGATSDEKDPEEFLNLLFKKVLVTSPFLGIRRPYGEDKEFFVQLFFDPPKDAVIIPTTQSLLHKMFLEQNITFTKYPLKLFLQVPRHGKEFKSFNRVIPTLNLDINILCETPQPCFICNKPGNFICTDCGNTDVLKPHIKHLCFCQNCSSLWHRNLSRVHHKPLSRKITDDYETGRLELLSVICIERSHYVCFTRVSGSGNDQWIFFDSMAERTDDERNLPQVTDCTKLLNDHVYGHKSIASIESKKLPELVRRFVEDAYLCIYVDTEGTMYQ